MISIAGDRVLHKEICRSQSELGLTYNVIRERSKRYELHTNNIRCSLYRFTVNNYEYLSNKRLFFHFHYYDVVNRTCMISIAFFFRVLERDLQIYTRFHMFFLFFVFWP